MRISLALATFTTTLVLLAACTDKPDHDSKKGYYSATSNADTVSYDVTTEGAFKGVKQVAIGSFKVGFVEETKAYEKEGNVSGKNFGTTRIADVELKGVDRRMMQRITDAAYADFISQLKAKGYTVVDRKTLLKNRDFAHANKEKSPLRKEASFFGSDTTITYVAPSAHEGLYFMGESGESGGFGFSNPQVAAINFAEENKTPVLFVTYQVDFADKAGANKATPKGIEVGQSISIPPGNGVKMIGGKGATFDTANGAILLGETLYSKAPFATIENKQKSATTSAVNLVSAVLGKTVTEERTFEVKADPAKYQAVSGKVLADANEKLVTKMAKLR